MHKTVKLKEGGEGVLNYGLQPICRGLKKNEIKKPLVYAYVFPHF